MRTSTPRFRHALATVAWPGVLVSAFLAGCGADEESFLAKRSEIVGGRPASNEQIRSTVAITDPSGNIECSGTLLTPTSVLSAAHCVVFEEAQLVLPVGNFRVSAGSLTVSGAPNLASVRSIRVHPAFRGLRSRHADELTQDLPANDLAVLVLDAPIRTIPPARILPFALVDALSPGTLVELAGFGEREQGTNGTLYVASTPYQGRRGPEFVAGGAGSPDTCFGDSGGPVYATVGSEVFLIGAGSRALAADGACGDGGIYTLVPAYEAWALEGMGTTENLSPGGGCSLGRRTNTCSNELFAAAAMLFGVCLRAWRRWLLLLSLPAAVGARQDLPLP